MQQSSPQDNKPLSDAIKQLDVSRLEDAAERMNLDPFSVGDKVSSCDIAGLPVLLDGRQSPRLVVVRMQTVGQELPLRRRTELLTFANEMNLRPYVSVSVQTVSEGLLLCVDGPIIAGKNGMSDAQFDDHFHAIYRSCRTIARRFNTEYGSGEEENPDDIQVPAASKPAPTGYDDQPGGHHRDDDPRRAERLAGEQAKNTQPEQANAKAAELEAKKKAEQEAKLKAEKEAEAKAAEAAKKKAAEETRRKAEEEARKKAEEAAAKKAEAARLAKQKAEKEAAELARRQQQAREKAEAEAKAKQQAAGTGGTAAATAAAGAAAGAATAAAVTGGLHTVEKEEAAKAAKAAAKKAGADGEEETPAAGAQSEDTAKTATAAEATPADENGATTDDEDEAVRTDTHAFDLDSWEKETCEYLPVTPERVIEWLKKRGINYQYDKNDQSLWCPMESMWYQITANLPNSLMVAAMSKTRLSGEDEVDLALVVANQLNCASLATIIVLDDVPMIASEASSFWPEGIADDQLFETLGRMFTQTADALDIVMDNFEDLKEMTLD